MKSKTLGCTGLVIGVTIGGGMLALPLTAAEAGFWPAMLQLVVNWMLMTFCALLILEVNLRLPDGSNLISMAKQTLGRPGKIIAWVSYLLLLYSLIAAYLAASAGFTHILFSHVLNNISFSTSAIIACALLMLIIYRGIGLVDILTRLLLVCKFVLFLLICALITTLLDASKLNHHDIILLLPSASVTLTAFGFAIIVPSMRSYLDGDAKRLRFSILAGSLVVLACYIIWDLIVMGTLPIYGEQGLVQIAATGQAVTALAQAYSIHTQHVWLTYFMLFFPPICVLSSCLGVAMSMIDFLNDGLALKTLHYRQVLLYALAFIPPLVLVLFSPKLFISALSYAGTMVVVLLALLPCAMAWRARYHQALPGSYEVWGRQTTTSINVNARIASIVC